MTEHPRFSDDDEIFLGRVEEQDRFQDALRAVQRDAKDPTKLPFVFLLYGEGGMGKSRLADRLREIATKEAAYKGHFRSVRLDWQKRKELDLRLVTRDSVSPETVFEHMYSIFRDEGFGRKFDPYEKAIKDRAQAETKVAQALEQKGEGGDRYSKLRELGGKGLTWLVRSGVVGGVPIPVPEEPTAKFFEAVIGGGVEGLARARETATALLRSVLSPDEFDLFLLPNETLARRLGDGIRASASRKPIVLVLDTYEIADRADTWLRVVIKRAGPRVVWVLAGRDNLADSRKFGQGYFTGYRAEFPSDRLRVFPLSEFSVGDVTDYFAGRVPNRPLDAESAEAVHRATLGVPLAVKEAAAIWANPTKTLNDITGDEAPSRDRNTMVQKMTERFLLHCLDDPSDKAGLYALALAYTPDADLLAAMLQSEDLERDLSDLERRHSFVFTGEMKLHNAVTAFFREYLLQSVHRRSVRDIHEYAVAHLQTQRKAREKNAHTLEARVGGERWTAAILGLTYHSFWLDEDVGWPALMPSLVGGLGYDRVFARALVETSGALAPTFTQSGTRRLKLLQDSLGGGRSPNGEIERLSANFLRAAPDIEQEAALLAELEASARDWPDDGCAAERRAILDLQSGKLLYRRGKYAEALELYDRAERGLPEQGEALRLRLGEALYDLASKFM